MQKRKIILGGYDSAEDGFWTLCSWKLSDPVHDQNFVKIPGSSVTLDLSTALTDDEPTYQARTLTATFESSEGDRLARKARIDAMINQLDGFRMEIVLPDDPDRYLNGRVSVREKYNDLAHASVSIEATCDPWKYSDTEIIVALTATSTKQTKTLTNAGRKSVVPAIEVTGSVNLIFEEQTWALSAGSYALPGIYLTPGSHQLTYSGSGTITLSYREAIL